MLSPAGRNVKKKVAIACTCLKSRENGSGALNRMLCARLKRGSLLALRAVFLKFICDTTGTGRTIPLNSRALGALKMWASQFSARQPEQFLFPSERYGAAGDAFEACAYDTDPSKAISSWKVAWEAAKRRAGAALEGKNSVDKSARPLSVRFSRSQAHCLHTNARRWCPLPCCGLNYGLECKHGDTHGKALRSHRAAAGLLGEVKLERESFEKSPEPTSLATDKLQ
jgi:hypothetical protein